MKKLFEPISVCLFIIGITIVNLWHVIYHALNRPPGTIFMGISHHYEDYFYYLSQVTQGAQGAWAVRNLYTTEAIPPTPLWWTNIFLGKLSVLLHILPWTMYDIALFITTAISLYAIYWAAKKLYPTDAHKRIAVLLVATLATCAYRYTNSTPDTKVIEPIVYFYNYTSSLNRLGGVVHLMVQNILSLVLIFLYADILKIIFWPREKYSLSHVEGKQMLTRKTVILSFCTFLLAFINPVYLIVDAVSCVIVTIGLFIMRFRVKRFVKILTVGAIIAIPLLLPFLLMQQAFQIPFYQYFRWWESSVLRAPINNFFLSYGALLVLVPLGIIPFLRRNTVLHWLGFLWAILPIALYWSPIPAKLQIPYFRLPQPASYIILGALAAEGIYIISHPELVSGSLYRFKKMLKLVQHDENDEGYGGNRTNKFHVFTFWLLITALLFFQLPMLREEIRARKENYTLISWLNHMDKSLYEGLLVLAKLPHDKTVLAFNNLELVVPAITGQQVYAAHRSLTLEYPRKIGEVAVFYTLQWTPEEAQNFFHNNNIGYVLWKKADGDATDFAKHYPFLTKYYENSALIIFNF